MKIIDNTIHFNSIDSFYNKEISELKCNTVRNIDYMTYKNIPELKFIAIHNKKTGYYFIRKIKDISYYDNRVIFSW